ncbi:DUF2087 domain-containing protein [Lactobacillus apis]|uniref:DUF2087 domain-containing protein n=1 Tax=Lactobacillus apis TaxID=303541 RepID=UPI000B1C5AA3|nr:DUF2087 domain-containing protein [Lactobacillus apis]
MMENKEIIARYLDDNGVVKTWPAKAKNRFLILQYLATKFEPTKKYSEQEVNLILMKYISNYVTRRRDLVENHLLSRTDDGRTYWLNTDASSSKN